MTVLQAGVAKSGNFWLYRIIKFLLDSGGVEDRSYIRGHPVHDEAKGWNLSFDGQADIDIVRVKDSGPVCEISSAFEEPIEDVGTYVAACRHIWTHSAWSPGLRAFHERCDATICIIRDPRNVAVSMSRFAFSPYGREFLSHGERTPEEFLRHRLFGMTLSWVQHVGSYLSASAQAGVHLVFYERLLEDFDHEAHRLAETLGLPLDEANLEALRHTVDWNRMRERHPNHVVSGRGTDWRHELTDAEIRTVARMAGPMLEILGYPLDKDDLSSRPSYAPGDATDHEIEAAIDRSRGAARDKLKYGLSFLTSRRPVSEKIMKGFRFLILGKTRG